MKYNPQDLDTPVWLPRSKEDLEEFIEAVTVAYDLPRKDDTADAIATSILHYAQDKGQAPLSYFGNKVHKFIANFYAFNKCEELKAKRIAEEEAKKTTLALVPSEEHKEPDAALGQSV